MNSSLPPIDLTKRKPYIVAMLLATIIAAIAQALVVAPTWLTFWATQSQNKEPRAQNPTPVVVAVPDATPSVTPQDVCSVWLSETSGKKYNFVCQGQNSFIIYEIKDQMLTNVGSGKIIKDGSVEAEILVREKNRTAHLRLRLSSNGRKIEGSWNGDDPREFGRVVFHKIEEVHPINLSRL